MPGSPLAESVPRSYLGHVQALERVYPVLDLLELLTRGLVEARSLTGSHDDRVTSRSLRRDRIRGVRDMATQPDEAVQSHKNEEDERDQSPDE